MHLSLINSSMYISVSDYERTTIVLSSKYPPTEFEVSSERLFILIMILLLREAILVVMKMNAEIDEIYQTARTIVEQDPRATATHGDAFGMDADSIVVHTTTIPLEGKKRIEIGFTTPEALPTFEWLAEITIDDETYRHFLLREDYSLVETYGQNVMPVSTQDAQALLKRLENIAQ